MARSQRATDNRTARCCRH